jgi:hypothetical protein
MANAPGSLRDDMRTQREFLGSRAPVYAKLLEILEAQLLHGLEARLEDAWRDRPFGAWYERPLLLAGSLRNDALREGTSHPLWRAIAQPDPDLSALTVPAVADAVAPERTYFWHTLVTRHLQTNDPSRAVACSSIRAPPGWSARGLQSLVLARCEPHPRRIDVDAQAVSRLRAAIDA